MNQKQASWKSAVRGVVAVGWIVMGTLGLHPLVEAGELSEADRVLASKLFKEYRVAATHHDGDGAGEVVARFCEKLPPEAAGTIVPFVAQDAGKALAAFGQAAEAALRRADPRRMARNPRVRQARATLEEIRKINDDDKMKQRLKGDGTKALSTLDTLLLPDRGALVEEDPESSLWMTRTEEWIALLDVLCVHAGVDPPRNLRAAMRKHSAGEVGLTALVGGGDRRTLDRNADLAAKLLPEEAAGIADANRLRILMGLTPLAIDLELCEAARGHSRDMAERGFFSHDSPVRGKEHFTDRALAAGTDSSAENIAIDGTAKGANMGWFRSPGHHRNLFGDHRRIGLGYHDGRWTQMFGD